MISIHGFNPYKFFEAPTLVSDQRLEAFKNSDKVQSEFDLQELDKFYKTLKDLKVKSILEDANLFEIIRLVEMELFPELGTNYGYDGRYLDGDKFGGKYVYFAPSYSFSSGLIDESTLSVLFANPSSNVLSIGAGGAGGNVSNGSGSGSGGGGGVAGTAGTAGSTGIVMQFGA